MKGRVAVLSLCVLCIYARLVFATWGFECANRAQKFGLEVRAEPISVGPPATDPGGPVQSPSESQPGGPINTSGTHTASTTSTGATPTATPDFVFQSIPSLTTCTQGTISWLYKSPSADMTILMTILITDAGVSQVSTTSGYNTLTDNGIRDVVPSVSISTTTSIDGDGNSDVSSVIYETLTNSANPSDFNYNWSSVNVPEGYYIAQALISGYQFTSFRFFVSNGSDISCLISTVPSVSMTPSPSPSNTSPPVTGVSSKVNRGAIAGGVVGGLAIAAAAVGALFFLRCSSRKRGGSSRSGIMGKWGNLGSFDSTTKGSPKNKLKVYNNGLAGSQRSQIRSSRHHSQADSLGPIMMSPTAQLHSSPTATEEDGGDYYSPYEKYHVRSPFSDDGHGHVDDMGTITVAYNPSNDTSIGANLSHASRHASASSTSSFTQDHSRTRSQSQRNLYVPSPQTVPETASNASIKSHRSSSPQLPNRYSPSLSPAYPSGTSATLSNASPSQSSPLAAGVVASSSVTQPNPSRRTPRKPVPSYDPHDPAFATFYMRQQDVSGGLQSMPPRSSNSSRADLPAEATQDLLHKSSFGSMKQMHYLIPDMPPPQRD